MGASEFTSVFCAVSEGLDAVVAQVAETIAHAAVEEDDGAVSNRLQRTLLVLDLSPENLELEFPRIGAQVIERRVFDELGGRFGDGPVAGRIECLDDCRFPGAGTAGNDDEFCGHRIFLSGGPGSPGCLSTGRALMAGHLEPASSGLFSGLCLV